jgi:hypothetical protein
MIKCTSLLVVNDYLRDKAKKQSKVTKKIKYKRMYRVQAVFLLLLLIQLTLHIIAKRTVVA